LRIVSFTDGFTSSTAPIVQGFVQENYTILNNQSSDVSLFTFNSTSYTSIFVDFQLVRNDSLNKFSQFGTLTIFNDGTAWNLSVGMYNNSDIIQDSITNPEHITLTVSNSGTVGSLNYKSGNMGSSYSGTFKIMATRIKTA
jgi:hypothetical protein